MLPTSPAGTIPASHVEIDNVSCLSTFHIFYCHHNLSVPECEFAVDVVGVHIPLVKVADRQCTHESQQNPFDGQTPFTTGRSLQHGRAGSGARNNKFRACAAPYPCPMVKYCYVVKVI
jgi:hypothetical protein